MSILIETQHTEGTMCCVSPFIGNRQTFIYGMPPEPIVESLLYDAFERHSWSSETSYENLRCEKEAGLVPTLLVGKPDVSLESKEAAAVFDAARRFRARLKSNG